jgi:hypothetical protein
MMGGIVEYGLAFGECPSPMDLTIVKDEAKGYCKPRHIHISQGIGRGRVLYLQVEVGIRSIKLFRSMHNKE